MGELKDDDIRIETIHFRMEKDFKELWSTVFEFKDENIKLRKQRDDLLYVKEENKRLKEELKNRGK